METGVGRMRRRRNWRPVTVIRRSSAAVVAGILLAVVPAGVAAELTLNANLHSWAEVGGSAGLSSGDPARIAYTPVSTTPVHQPNGVTVAAAGLAGIVAILALMLGLVVLSCASFFLLGSAAVVLLAGVGAMWGTQLGCGCSCALAT